MDSGSNSKVSNSKYILEMVVFVCGAVVMIFELVGSRVIGPYVGTSIYAWTSLIGVVLASLSLGYYAGGYLADKKPTSRPLAIILLFSASAIAFSVFTKDIFSSIISVSRAVLEVKSLMISFVLFAPASFFLGMVTPYAIKLRMKDIARAGRTTGNLYAISTLGSIFGTFLAGFYIIPKLGSTNTLIILSIVLLAMSAVLMLDEKINKLVAKEIVSVIIFIGLALVLSIVKKEIIIADIDTEYNRIWVFNTIDDLTKKPITALSTDIYGIQGAVFADGTKDLVFDYINFFKSFSHFMPNPSSALMIGGAPFTYPRHFVENYPNAKIDVIEIDPGATEIAKKYFGLEDKDNLNIYHQDARIYLNENKKKYDVIFVDAFGSASSTPFHLTTKEAVSKEYEALNKGGVVMFNMLSSIDGEKGKFARAEYATYKHFFPQVYIFKSRNMNNPAQTGSMNIMLIALKSEKIPTWESSNIETNDFLSLLLKDPIANDLPILTDDFAPVEYYRRMASYAL